MGSAWGVGCMTGAAMAAAVLTDQGEQKALNAVLAPKRWLRLFRNDVPVSNASVLSDFEQALFPGYADVDVSSLWPAALIDGTGRAYSQLPNVQWTRGVGGVPEVDYGWVLYELPAPDSVMVCGQRFSAPITTTVPGQIIVVSILALLLRG